MRYFFRVEYDGTSFGGWQHQKNTPSIQDALEHAFSTVIRVPCRVTGAGRTDAGVHALAQGAHIDVGAPLDVRACEHSVNALLPPAIAVDRLQPVDASFHARFSACSRRYDYCICDKKHPLLFNRAWPVFYPLDWDRIRKETALLCGAHDFSAFCSSGSGVSHARCTVVGAAFEPKDGCAVFTIEADRFVYNMVRTLVGTLIDMGRGRIARSTSMADILISKDRTLVGTTAPACGLTLRNVTYQGVD
jgi:tRNA pseudouridine38-40 synthase